MFDAIFWTILSIYFFTTTCKYTEGPISIWNVNEMVSFTLYMEYPRNNAHGSWLSWDIDIIGINMMDTPVKKHVQRSATSISQKVK